MDEAPFAARVGTMVHANWHLDSLLGVGGMAAVYAATDRGGKRVALKILHREYQDDAKILIRFRREAEVATLVSHPAIVRIHGESFMPLAPLDGEPTEPSSRRLAVAPGADNSTDEAAPNTERALAHGTELVRTEEGEPFLVMDLLEGESIRDIWRRHGRTLPLQECLQIAERVVDCLIACHDAGIIHRDIKPANLYRTRSGEIKVLDFGVAQVQGSSIDLNAAGTALGTPAYLAPEQAMGLAAQLDGRSDLFSVGAVLHALMTGHRLHAGRTAQESLILAASKPAPSIVHIAPNLPQPVVRLIDKALAWDRSRRFSDAREMHEAILAAATLAQAWDDDALDQALAPPPESLAPRPLLLDPELSPRHSISLAPSADVSGAKQAFMMLNDVISAVREFEWHHPAAERALGRAHEALLLLLDEDEAWGSLTVRPYAFSARGITVWETPVPFDGIPHRLFAAGVRTLELHQGITDQELRDLLAILMLDPEKDLACEDNHATVLWESDFEHVTFRTVEASVEGDAETRTRFWRASEAWQGTLEDHVARYASATEAEGQNERLVVHLPPEERVALLVRLAEDERQGVARHVASLARAYAHVASLGDASPMLRAFREASEAELGQGHFDDLCTFFENMCGELRALITAPSVREPLLVALADALFGGDAFVLLGRYLAANPSDIVLARPILELLGPSELPRALDAARNATGELRELFLGYVARVGRGREEALAAAAGGLDADGTYAFLEALTQVATPEAKTIVQELTESSDPVARVSALVVVQEDEDARMQALSSLLADPAANIRLQALRLAQRNHATRLLSDVSKLIADGAPVSDEELLERMRTLLVLGGTVAEAQITEIAKKGGIFVSKSREVARKGACLALGEYSSERATAAVLDDVATTRLGTSDEVRSAARRAARAIRERADADETDETAESADSRETELS